VCYGTTLGKSRLAADTHPAALTAALRGQAGALGFELVGFCPAVAPGGINRFQEWLRRGYVGEMRYLDERAAAYAHPDTVLQGVRSLVVLGAAYRTQEPRAHRAGEARVSRYAWGDDYHDVVHDRLRRLAGFLKELLPAARVRGVVDTAPLMEREFARLAGLGWIGKNTLVLNRDWGSWFFLSVLLTDAELVYDAPHETEHCGTCRACLDACPTRAFVEPYVLDARRCISYLTIESQSSIPMALRPQVQDWVFGCDICQEVCPWNHRAPRTREPAFEPDSDRHPVDLVGLFDLDEAGFRRRFRHTALWRAKRRGFLRNAAIVLGNQRDAAAVPALVRGLSDEDPMVRGASAWALGQVGGLEAREHLQGRLAIEADAETAHEIRNALETIGSAIRSLPPQAAAE
jgi:epoxyqueuosine reductase